MIGHAMRVLGRGDAAQCQVMQLSCVCDSVEVLWAFLKSAEQ